MAERCNITVAKYRLGEEPRVDEDVRLMDPAERLALQWELTKSAWGISGDADEPVFRRDIVRVIRPDRQ